MDVLIELIIRGIAALFRDRGQAQRPTAPPPPPPPPGSVTDRPLPPALEELRRMAAARPRPGPGVPQQRQPQQPQRLAPPPPAGQRGQQPRRMPQQPQQRIPQPPQQRRRVAKQPGRAAPPPPLPAAPAPAPAEEAPQVTTVRPATAPANQLRPAISAADIRRLISQRPGALRTMWVLAEVLQPPVSMRETSGLP